MLLFFILFLVDITFKPSPPKLIKNDVYPWIRTADRTPDEEESKELLLLGWTDGVMCRGIYSYERNLWIMDLHRPDPVYWMIHPIVPNEFYI